ncbi:MAG TPA: D-alanyl-D-alanine carboxypeptidase [Lachnospiraceae bacterium]|nr:D-alanyl-D-alanine carboxypeptidase [Lachnospiraceae bacterium]
MYKKVCKGIAILMIVILHMSCFSIDVMAEKATVNLSLQSKSAILMEADTGEVIYEENSHEKLPPASVTKVMTILLIYEAVADGKIKWDDKVTVSEHAASMGGSQVFLEPNEQQTVKDMTKCISVASANDAAVAMAEYIGGSENGFVDMMNNRAKELGMNDTTFVNACGLDVDGHVTSANDIAIMSRELIKNHSEVTEFTKTWMDTITHTTRKGESEFGLTNTNKLVKWYNGATGLKTGFTQKSMFCLSGTASRDGLDLVAVVMGAPDSTTRFREVMQLLDYGFANYTVLSGREEGSECGEVKVYKGKEDFVKAIVATKVKAPVKKGGEKQLNEEVILEEVMEAPIEQGGKIGEIIYSLDGKEVGRSDVVAGASVEKIKLFGMVGRLKGKWIA